METKNNDMDELFRQSFENFEPEPPEEIKALIDKQLQFKTKRGFGRFWYLGILGIILAVSTLAYFSLNKTGSNKRIQLAKNNSSTQLVDTDTFKHKSELKNDSSQSSKFHSTSTNFSSNSKSNDTFKNNGAKKHKNVTDKVDYIQTKSLKEKSTFKSTQKINKLSKKYSKNGKNNRKRNSHKSNKVFLSQNFSVDDELKKGQEVNQKDNELATKIDKPSEETIKTEAEKNKNIISKKDSTANSLASTEVKDTTQLKDSSQMTNQNPDINNPAKTSPFLFAFKTDYLVPLGKQDDNDFKFSNNNAFHFQAEATYLLRSSIGVNSGINYFSSSQSFSKTTTSVDSTFTGFTYQPVYADSNAYIYDSNNVIIDSILITYVIDSISQANYEINNVNTIQSSNFRISSFSIPLLFYYNQKLNPNLSLDLMAGGILSFQQIKFRDASNPLNNELSLNKFGVKAILKTSLRYQFNHFGVSLNNTLMYDLKPIQYQSVKARKLSYGFGCGVFWKI